MKVKDMETLFLADPQVRHKTLHEVIQELSEMEETPTIKDAIYLLQELESIAYIAKRIGLAKKPSYRFADGTKVRYTNKTTNYRLQTYVGQIGTVLSSSRLHSGYLHQVEFEDGETINILGRFLEPVKA